MAIVVGFIREYAPWVYGACALVALWYLRVVILARHERRYAMFSLEREAALNRVYGAGTVAIVLLAIMGLIYLLSTVVSDAVQPLVEQGEQPITPEVVAGGPPSATPTLPVPEVVPPTETSTPRPRPTRLPEPVVVADTPTPAIKGPRCPDARAIITSPGLGAAVSGAVPIFGTAIHESFQFYKLEYGVGADPPVWSYFDGAEQPVQNGQLGTFDAGALPPGTYSIRIVVVDSTGNFPPPCQTVILVR